LLRKESRKNSDRLEFVLVSAKRVKVGWVIALGAAWMLGFGASSFAQKTSAEAEKKRLDELRGRIEELQRNVAKSEESRTEAADALKTTEKAISEVNRNLTQLNLQQNTIGQSLAETQKSIDANRADVAKQQNLLDRVIRHQYMHGSADALRLVLDGQDVAKVERELQYFGYISKSRALLIAKLKQTLTNLAELEAGARVKKDELAANAIEQQKARAAIDEERVARQKMLNRIAGDISKGRSEIGRLKRDEDRLSKLVDQITKELIRSAARRAEQLREQKRAQERAKELERELEKKQQAKGSVPGNIRKPDSRVEPIAPATPAAPLESVVDAGFVGLAFESLRGKLKLPARGELAGRFGTPRENGSLTWKGVFIKAESGQSVRAVADGQVVFADWLRGFGNLLILDHGNGYMSLYGNNESLLKSVGENTRAGENIASVGSTGGALESGVYFELRHEGKPFDPMKWIGR
jgi:murein hydrolase activator